MEETTDRRPNQEPTLLDQIEEQQPSTVQTEAEIHFDEGATHSDRLQVNVIQLEPRENPLEQPVDIPPGPSGIQHSPSQEIEVAAHSQPSTPTNEAATLDIEEQQPTHVTTEAAVHFSESGRVSFRPDTLRLGGGGKHQTNQRPGSNIIEPVPGVSEMQQKPGSNIIEPVPGPSGMQQRPGSNIIEPVPGVSEMQQRLGSNIEEPVPGPSGMQQRPGSNIIEPVPGPSGMQYLTPSPSPSHATLSGPPTPWASWMNINTVSKRCDSSCTSNDLYNYFTYLSIIFIIFVFHIVLFLLIWHCIIMCFNTAGQNTCNESEKTLCFYGFSVYLILLIFGTSSLTLLVKSIGMCERLFPCKIQQITCCCQNRRHEEENIDVQNPNRIPQIIVTNATGT